MNNSNKWKNKKRGGNNSAHGGNNSGHGGNNSAHGGNNSGHGGNNSAHGGNHSGQGGKNWTKGKGSKRNQQNNQRSKGSGRHFQKFVDTEHMNHESNYWAQEETWNCDNRRTNDYQFNENPAHRGEIIPWIRNKPANELIIPQHINFEEQYERAHQESDANTILSVQQRETESTEMIKEPLRVINKEINAPKCENNTVVTKPPSEVHQSLETNYCVKIKQEKDLQIRLKKEKKSSSSSSSSSESSSSEEEIEHNIKAQVPVKPEITSIAKPPSSPLNVKLKPRNNSVSSTQIKISEKFKQLPEISSSSSSSSDEESSPVPVTSKTEKKGMPKNLKKSESTFQKIGSEDDVVCVGNLENKIVLIEDKSDNSSTDEEPRNKAGENVLNELSKKSEKCMICDKKGHTSFQCQMICKNCSAPYHGYRTCPHPANLNTMMQLFIEFCMQQLQNFQAEKQSSASSCNNVPKPKVDSSHLITTASRANKLKRKPVRVNESSKKHKKSKKRKVSNSKKTKSKANSDESSDDDSEDKSDTDTSSTATDKHISDSSAESLVSSKKKRKLKSANASKAALDLSSFSTNSVGLPVVLNGFPHLTVPTTSLQNSNSSTNALNTLLLTQMFQNAIGSLKK